MKTTLEFTVRLELEASETIVEEARSVMARRLGGTARHELEAMIARERNPEKEAHFKVRVDRI